MKRKKVFLSELAYIAGILALAFGTALMERADFGMSMVVAPAYLLYLKISQYLPWFTFGMSEYMLQAVLIVILSVVLRKFKNSYLFSFATAVLYGFMLDLSIEGISAIDLNGIAWQLVFFISGMALCSTGISLLFHTYIAPEAYELFVKEISATYNLNINKVKTVYDCCSCVIGIALSFAFFGIGHFEGVKLGTIFCALINGSLIGQISRLLESEFVFKDALPWRNAFTQ